MARVEFKLDRVSPATFRERLRPWVQDHRAWEVGIYSWALQPPLLKHDMDCTRVVINTLRTNNETNLVSPWGNPRISFECWPYRADQIQVIVPDVPVELDAVFGPLLSFIASIWPEAATVVAEPAAPMPERGPSAEILQRCRDAMENWLDKSLSIQKACELAGVADKTLRKWAPTVLGIVDEGKRQEWVRLLKAQGKTNLLGKYGQ